MDFISIIQSLETFRVYRFLSSQKPYQGGITMPKIMEKAEAKNFSKPDETRSFPLGKVELVNVAGATIGRAIFQPGWRWSTSVKPMIHTNSCEAPHFQYHVSGTLQVMMDDGIEMTLKAGDISNLPMGHDAWVVGNEPVVIVDFQGMVDYAKKSAN